MNTLTDAVEAYASRYGQVAGRSFLARLLTRVDASRDCWLWLGAKSHGYGHLWRGADGPPGASRLIFAHRAMWEVTHGPIPHGLFLCHHCDNPACVNPSHLFIGTAKDNMQDCKQKGRMKMCAPKFGSDNHKAKLTWESVRHLRREYALGVSISDLSRQMGIARSTVREVVNGRCWRDASVERKPRNAPSQRLSDEQRAEMERLYLSGVPSRVVAKQFGVTRAYVAERIRDKAERRGLHLEKRQRTVTTEDGRRLRISERRFVPQMQAAS